GAGTGSRYPLPLRRDRTAPATWGGRTEGRGCRGRAASSRTRVIALSNVPSHTLREVRTLPANSPLLWGFACRGWLHSMCLTAVWGSPSWNAPCCFCSVESGVRNVVCARSGCGAARHCLDDVAAEHPTGAVFR